MFEKIKSFGTRFPKLAMIAIVLTVILFCFLVFYGFVFGLIGCILLGAYFMLRLSMKRYNRIKKIDNLVSTGLVFGTLAVLAAVVCFNIFV